MTPELQARSRQGWLRVLFFCPLALFCSVALAAERSSSGACDDVPEGERRLCLMVQACATLADAANRQECFAAAADRLTGPETRSVELRGVEAAPIEPARAETVQPAPIEREAVQAAVVEHREAPASPTEPSAEAPVADEKPSRIRQGMRTLGGVRRLFTRRSETQEDEIPRRFTAQVTAYRDLVRDRQLVVLDDKLLFEGDNAASSAIRVGDEVRVVKVSSRRGRSYQITGPSRRYFTALRIRCESGDLSADNRRKCDRMMGDPDD